MWRTAAARAAGALRLLQRPTAGAATTAASTWRAQLRRSSHAATTTSASVPPPAPPVPPASGSSSKVRRGAKHKRCPRCPRAALTPSRSVALVHFLSLHAQLAAVQDGQELDDDFFKDVPAPPRQPRPLSEMGAWIEPELARWAAARNPNRPASPSFYTSNAPFYDFLFYLEAHLEYLRKVAEFEAATGLRAVYIKPANAGLVQQREAAAARASNVYTAATADDSASSASEDEVSDDDVAEIVIEEKSAAAGADATAEGAKGAAAQAEAAASEADDEGDDSFDRAIAAREAAEAAAAEAALAGRPLPLPSWLLKADMEALLGTRIKTTEYRRIVNRLNAIASEPNAYVLAEFLDTFRRSHQSSRQIVREHKPDALGRLYATGRRKNAIARVWLVPGREAPAAAEAGDGAARQAADSAAARVDGTILVNGKPSAEYFERWSDREILVRPFRVGEVLGQCNVWATVEGGGKTGQSQALALGISKALQYWKPDLRPALKKGTPTRCAQGDRGGWRVDADGAWPPRALYGVARAQPACCGATRASSSGKSTATRRPASGSPGTAADPALGHAHDVRC